MFAGGPKIIVTPMTDSFCIALCGDRGRRMVAPPSAHFNDANFSTLISETVEQIYGCCVGARICGVSAATSYYESTNGYSTGSQGPYRCCMLEHGEEYRPPAGLGVLKYCFPKCPFSLWYPDPHLMRGSLRPHQSTHQQTRRHSLSAMSYDTIRYEMLF